MAARITKRLVDGLQATGREFHVWDDTLPGFGIRVHASGAAAYIAQYRAGSGRSAPTRRVTLGAIGKLTPDEARKLARAMLADVAKGGDPAATKARERTILTVAVLADRFLDEHVKAKRKAGTLIDYRSLIGVYIKPALGRQRADKLSRADVSRFHLDSASHGTRANRALAVLSSMFEWGAKHGLVPEGHNPARGIERYRENKRERFLSPDELQRLGTAIHEAETIGIPWEPDPTRKVKHAPKPENRRAKIGPDAAAAIRLLLFTGARLREILHLRWSEVDLDRGLLFLGDSKTGRKTIVLNSAAIAVLSDLPRIGPYVFPGEPRRPKDGRPAEPQPRADLKRPWALVSKRAGLEGVRLHDLRHTHASIGAGAGLGLPIIGKLLGHSQAATTARYAHLADDPLRRASEAIGSALAAAMGEPGATNPGAETAVPLRRAASK